MPLPRPKASLPTSPLEDHALAPSGSKQIEGVPLSKGIEAGEGEEVLAGN